MKHRLELQKKQLEQRKEMRAKFMEARAAKTAKMVNDLKEEFKSENWVADAKNGEESKGEKKTPRSARKQIPTAAVQ